MSIIDQQAKLFFHIRNCESCRTRYATVENIIEDITNHSGVGKD